MEDLRVLMDQGHLVNTYPAIFVPLNVTSFCFLVFFVPVFSHSLLIPFIVLPFVSPCSMLSFLTLLFFCVSAVTDWASFALISNLGWTWWEAH